MIESVVQIDCSEIHDWESFHDVFANAFQFPPFYGRNMDAWIDCLSSIDTPEDGLTGIHVEPGEVLTIELSNVESFRERCPDQFQAIIDCAAFVNWRRLESGSQSVLAVSYYK